MPAITITDLNNAKLDVDHIAAFTTSTALTVTDRLGQTKPSLAGAIASIQADIDSIEVVKNTTINTTIPAKVAEVEARKVTAITVDIPNAIATVAAINNRSAWAATTAYALKDIVLTGGTWYMCVVAHTSSTAFATDTASKWRVYQGVTSGDLGDANDPTKGAALVADKGTTVSRSLALNQRKPRKLFSKLFAAASSASHVRHVLLGDSLANVKIQQLVASLDRRIGGANPAIVNSAGNRAGAGYGSGGNDCEYASPVSVVLETGAYNYWPTGNIFRIDAGGACGWGIGNANPIFTDVQVYYIAEPGAGTINLVVGGATVATASANASTGLGVLTYTQAVAKASIATTVAGASVRVLFVHTKNTTVSGLDQYGSMAVGGLLLANATVSAQGRAIWQAALANISPDFITFEMDDDFGTDTPTNTALDYLSAMLDTACPYADKLIIGSTPRATNDAGKLASSNYLRGYCGSRNASWLFFDSYYLLGSYAEMNAIFGVDDGTHPTASAEAFVAEVMWEFLGLNGFNLGYVPRAINDPGTPSKLARNTIFQGPGSDRGADLTVETDGSTGYDWQVKFPRVLTFQTRGAYGSVATASWQFSGNIAVAPHIVPIAFDFVSAGNVRKLATSTSSGYEFTQFKKTDNPGGGYMNMQTGLIRSNFTRTELLAIGANQVSGSIAYCTDCTGGAQIVYARGQSPTDWVTVDGKTAI